MKVERITDAAFRVEFESEQELLEEHRLNLSQGGMGLPNTQNVALHSTLLVTLCGPWGGEAHVRATAVAMIPDGVALAISGNPEENLERLLANKPEVTAVEEVSAGDKNQNTWDRIRTLSQMEKLLLAVKADRSERAVLLQDNDPRVLLSLLRNPRLTVEEVARMARSSFLTYQIADVIMKAAQWTSNLDVRAGLVNNPKTPPAFAMRILPTLPVADIRAIARAGTNMALKQAALRLLQGR